MSDLKFAHNGYSYQDLLGAVAAVDLILGQAERVWCDTRLCGDHDKFDDLTIESADGRRARHQIKHKEDARALDVDTFARTSRKLLLSEVFRGIRADEATFPEQAERSSYTIYLRDTEPTDEVLNAVLTPAHPDLGPSVPGTQTTRYRFDPNALWAGVQRPGAGRRAVGDAWGFLRRGEGTGDAAASAEEPGEPGTDADRLVFDREEVIHLCERLVVEVNAPAMSSDFAQPGPLELVLLTRLHTEVGVGEYPNEARQPADVAALLVAAAAKARQTHQALTRHGILSAIGLRTDYGSVSRRSPAVADQQVSRGRAVEDLRDAVDQVVQGGGFVIAQAPPGQGKSWVADQLVSSLLEDHWTVAEHYCFLNDSEEERDDRVAAERVFGSLMERVAAAHPHVASKQRPIFSADEHALMQLVSDVVSEQELPVALMIDGLDHVTRVQGFRPGAMSASEALAWRIAEMQVPAGCAVIVLSQAGEHLAPLIDANAVSVLIPAMDEVEIGALAGRLGLLASLEGEAEHAPETAGNPERLEASPSLSQDERVTLIRTLFQRSAGNPLYATYLVRELMRSRRAELDLFTGSAIEMLGNIPPYDGDLGHYYAHLAALLDDPGQAAADTLTLVDFPMTERELKDVQPGQAHRIHKALGVLQPVLRTSPRGYAIYHESFARFLRKGLEEEPAALEARIDAIVAWLDGLGLFHDARAFNSMLPLLASVGRDEAVLTIVDRSFAAAAIGAGYSPATIRANLAIAIRCGQRSANWSAVVRCLELMRGVETYEQERLADLDLRFVGVRVALFGGEHIVGRMLREGLAVLPPEPGLLLCAELDRAGFVPPWRTYLTAWRDRPGDNDREPEHQTVAALLRGQLRLIATEGADVFTQPGSADANPDDEPPPYRESPGLPANEGSRPDSQTTVERVLVGAPSPEPMQTGLSRILTNAAQWCDATGALDRCRIVVSTVVDVLDLETVARMSTAVQSRGAFLLAIAEELGARDPTFELAPFGPASGWATRSANAGVPAGQAHRLLALKAAVGPPGGEDEKAQSLQAALAATSEVLERHGPHALKEFLDALVLCRESPVALDAVINALSGEGWYRCWLRFCVDLARAEAAAPNLASTRAMEALRRLSEDARPFAGSPRAVDLFQEMDLIWETVARAIRLVGVDDWPSAIELLLDAGRQVTRSIKGEMGVPLPPDRTLHLALETMGEEHADFLLGKIASELERSHGRFYSDISEFRLVEVLCHLRRAEIADEHGDQVTSRAARDRADAAWRWACSAMLAYGWHKDRTVYELLDPLESLVTLDKARGLLRMARAHDLAYRAWRHSDGRETRHAPLQWWRMLAAADPIAHAEQSLRKGLASRGNRTHWEEMREDLWETHALLADPAVAVVLAATLSEVPDSSNYATVVDRFDRLTPAPGLEARHASLLQRALARGDEVSVMAGDTEQPTRSYDNIGSLNALATSRGLRRVEARSASSAGESDGQAPKSVSGRIDREDQDALAGAMDAVRELAQSAPDGMAGAAVLARAWRRGAADVGRGEGRSALIEAYARAFEPRISAMIEAQQRAELSSILEALAEVFPLNDTHMLLVRIGELLEKSIGVIRGADSAEARRDAAARAFALAWTQARQDGGWVRFGGRDHLPLISRATEISSHAAAQAVGTAVERSVTNPRSETLGVTKALIEAICAGALERSDDQGVVDAAFEAWDEAFGVISDRLPPLPQEEAGSTYDGAEREPPPAVPELAAIDYALALSAFAGLSHPGRENLRRTLLALDDLANLRPQVFAHALPTALDSATGAVLPILLLSMLDRLAASQPSLVSESANSLRAYLSSPYLSVRALARRVLRILTTEELAAPISDPASYPQVAHPHREVQFAKSLIPLRALIVERRIDGFVDTVLDLITRGVDDEDFRHALNAAGREMGNNEWPDALLLCDHVTEEALQLAAGGLRAKLASQGTLVRNPILFEDRLAETLALTPLPLMAERGRIPRPILALPTDGEPLSTPVAGVSDAGQDHDFRTPAPDAWVPESATQGAPYADWVLIAFRETKRSEPSGRRGDSDVRTYVAAGVELDSNLSAQPGATTPLADISVAQWFSPKSRSIQSAGQRPVQFAAKAEPTGWFVDDDACLGLPEILAPTEELVGVLGLTAASLDESTELVMNDSNGPALAHVHWRSDYSHSDRYLSYPRLAGSALLLRPDLAVALSERWGSRLTWRVWLHPSEQEETPDEGPT